MCLAKTHPKQIQQMMLSLLLSVEFYQCHTNELTSSKESISLSTGTVNSPIVDKDVSEIETSTVIIPAQEKQKQLNQKLYDALLQEDFSALIKAVEAGAEINIIEEIAISGKKDKYTPLDLLIGLPATCRDLLYSYKKSPKVKRLPSKAMDDCKKREEFRLAALTYLFKHGGNPNFFQDMSGTPLMKAVKKADYPAVKILLEHGANVQIGTPVHSAALKDDPRIIELLVRYGAEVNALQKGQITPLMLAASFGTSPAVVKALLDAGADPFRKNEGNAFAVDMAKHLGHRQSERLLRETMRRQQKAQNNVKSSIPIPSLKKSPKKNGKDNRHMITTLHFVNFIAVSSIQKIVTANSSQRLLIQAGDRIWIVDESLLESGEIDELVLRKNNLHPKVLSYLLPKTWHGDWSYVEEERAIYGVFALNGHQEKEIEFFSLDEKLSFWKQAIHPLDGTLVQVLMPPRSPWILIDAYFNPHPDIEAQRIFLGERESWVGFPQNSISMLGPIQWAWNEPLQAFFVFDEDEEKIWKLHANQEPKLWLQNLHRQDHTFEKYDVHSQKMMAALISVNSSTDETTFSLQRLSPKSDHSVVPLQAYSDEWELTGTWHPFLPLFALFASDGERSKLMLITEKRIYEVKMPAIMDVMDLAWSSDGRLFIIADARGLHVFSSEKVEAP